LLLLLLLLRLWIPIQDRIYFKLPVKVVEEAEEICCFGLGEEICRGRDWDRYRRGKEFGDGGVESELEVGERDGGLRGRVGHDGE